MQESQTEEEEMQQQERMKTMSDMTRKIKAKDRMDVNNSWWVNELLAADCWKGRGSTRIGGRSWSAV